MGWGRGRTGAENNRHCGRCGGLAAVKVRWGKVRGNATLTHTLRRAITLRARVGGQSVCYATADEVELRPHGPPFQPYEVPR